MKVESTCAKESPKKFWEGINGSKDPIRLIKEEFWAGKTALEILMKSLEKPRTRDFTVPWVMGIKVIETSIVPENELWFIQDGELKKKFIIEKEIP